MNPIELKIAMLPNGQIQVSGPLDQKVLCYGMLEAAKETIAIHHQKKAASGIIPAPAGALNRLPTAN